jgi:hypothetical protein
MICTYRNKFTKVLPESPPHFLSNVLSLWCCCRMGRGRCNLFRGVNRITTKSTCKKKETHFHHNTMYDKRMRRLCVNFKRAFCYPQCLCWLPETSKTFTIQSSIETSSSYATWQTETHTHTIHRTIECNRDDHSMATNLAWKKNMTVVIWKMKESLQWPWCLRDVLLPFQT